TPGTNTGGIKGLNDLKYGFYFLQVGGYVVIKGKIVNYKLQVPSHISIFINTANQIDTDGVFFFTYVFKPQLLLKHFLKSGAAGYNKVARLFVGPFIHHFIFV